MYMIRHLFTFLSLLLLHINRFKNHFQKKIFLKIFSCTDNYLRSKLIENNQKRNNTKEIFLLILSLLFWFSFFSGHVYHNFFVRWSGSIMINIVSSLKKKLTLLTEFSLNMVISLQSLTMSISQLRWYL